MAEHVHASGEDHPSSTGTIDFRPWGEKHQALVKSEIEAINTRREAGRQIETAQLKPGQTIDVVGLALSGGGIRSSAVCLGVLQALNHHDVIKRIDYLSTVSGGGYIGSSLTATMTVAKRFVFGQPPNPGAKSAKASEVSDTPEVGHIRNYSNYLVPAGARDLLTGLAIVVRGLVANVGLTLPIVLVLAIVTIMSNPARSALYAANVFGVSVNNDCDRLHWISERIGFFSLIGLVLGLAIYVVGRLRYGAPSRRYGDTLDEIRRDRWELFAYGAGIAITLGVICDLARFMPVDHFGLTLTASIAGLVMFFFWWAIWRSYLPANRLQEFRGLRTQQDNSTGAVLFGRLPTIAATYLVLLFLIAFFEFQPFMIAEMFDNADAASDAGLGVVAGVAVTWLKSLAAITAPIAAAVTLFRQQFAALLKGKGTSDLLAIVLAHSANLAIWIAGAALPLLIWIAYLYLTFWGITNDKLLPQRVCPNAVIEWPSLDQIDTVRRSKTHLSGKLQFDSDAGTLSAEIKDRTTQRAHTRKIREGRQIEHAPGWVNSAAGTISHALRSFGLGGAIDAFKPRFGESVRWSVIALYLIFAIVLFRCSWCLAPNANSLHRLYRDRLSKAFLFKPLPRNEHAPDTDVRHKPARNVASIDQGRDLEPLDELKLSSLCAHGKLHAPYHLINTALNIQGSDFANRRGRNADFFVFAPLCVGSEATGYAPTLKFESGDRGLDLATALAISGAAASSNMGSDSIRALTPTLALLNVRLGFWLKNPRYAENNGEVRRRPSPFYLWSEISGRLYENSDAVYLTDGGHIENLGVYELLRRRCRVIIAVDAEADAPMNSSSLVTLQRYARIDLGIIIDLPWSPIRTCTLGWMACNAGKPPTPTPKSSDGPHVAIGTIDYGGGDIGYLIYIKSSLTGDENDYIRDYARRYERFPHESTGDQFFSEEQFEVYRALGFHIAHRFLAGLDDVSVRDKDGKSVRKRLNADGIEPIGTIRAALGLAVSP
ncbi:patatin-like phospholipase family protein [Bradyrhizobium sp. CCGUVB1N3]|uniref:patatin-like phospholipase family protein n=1 Tax=Bradyrhizobium sp. CCGUVB1N3 TaxID=2949629 RepID=UPI0020B20E4C|nr:patatin-like phospholipase family protein [Bradyrhizobium sp. CCGUVB1N3]MCP3473653.1 patatin-like phospholipase family protein [Bradyrhizobium sp. CCGUVB1N3]